MNTHDRLKAERDAVRRLIADRDARSRNPMLPVVTTEQISNALDALIEKAIALGVEPLVALPCYRINWQRETRELDCRALLRTMTSQPFEAVRLCPRCAATGNSTVL